MQNRAIETARLRIRAVRAADLDDICEYGADPEAGRYMRYWPKTRAKIADFIDTCIGEMSNSQPSWYEFAIILREHSKMIGNISLVVEADQAEIGWISNRRYWNHGYMTEAAQAVIHLAFDALGMRKIIGTCHEENIGSARVMEKCGMARAGHEEGHQMIKDGVAHTYTRLIYCIEKGK
ncbi:GNAT family N-acetyltransferase [Chloroflexia bacterium SDU3-3]|nr:GNAT family N-acetyltransferase [Chloroflexia bacterium SDU3-3]